MSVKKRVLVTLCTECATCLITHCVCVYKQRWALGAGCQHLRRPQELGPESSQAVAEVTHGVACQRAKFGLNTLQWNRRVLSEEGKIWHTELAEQPKVPSVFRDQGFDERMK